MTGLTAKIHWIFKGKGSKSAILQTLLSRIIVIALNLLTGVITARTLGAEGRGEQSAILLWPQFLAYTLTLGLPSALIYRLKRNPERKSELVTAAIVLGAGLGMLAATIGIVFIPTWLNQYSPETIRISQWFMASSPLILMTLIGTSALESTGEFSLANQIRYIPSIITLGLLIGLLTTKTVTPLTTGVAYLLPNLPLLIWILIELQKRFNLCFFNFNLPYNQLLSYGIRSYGIDLLGILSGQMSQVLVSGLLPPNGMGLYVVAVSYSRMLNILHSSTITVLFPRITGLRIKEEIIHITERAARLSTVITTIAAVGLATVSPILLPSIYGREFSQAVWVLCFLIIEVILSGLTWILVQPFMALDHPEIPAILQGIGLAANLPLGYFLIPRYGLEGAGVAFMISTLIRLSLSLMAYPLILKVHLPNLIFQKGDWIR